MKKILITLLGVILFATSYAQKGEYYFDCSDCVKEIEGSKSVTVSYFTGATFYQNDKQVAKIPSPLDIVYENGKVKFYTLTNLGEYNNLPTSITVSFSQLVKSDYSNYTTIDEVKEALSGCGLCSSSSGGSGVAFRDNGNGTVELDDGSGNVTTIQQGWTVATNNLDGSISLTYPDGSVFLIPADCCPTMLDNGDGTFTFTDGAGNDTNIKGGWTTVNVNPDNSVDFTLPNGGTINYDETLTSLTWNPLTLLLTYTDEDGTPNDISLNNVISRVTAIANGTYEHESGVGTSIIGYRLGLASNGDIQILTAQGVVANFVTPDYATVSSLDGSVTVTNTGNDYDLSVTHPTNLDNDPTNEIQSIGSVDGSVIITQTGDDYDLSVISDSTRLIQDSILVYYHNGSEIGRDTVRIQVPSVPEGDINFLDQDGIALARDNLGDVTFALDRDLYIRTTSTEGSIANSISTSFADAVPNGSSFTDIQTIDNVVAIATRSADNSGNYSIVSGNNPTNSGAQSFLTGTNAVNTASNSIVFGGSSVNNQNHSIVGGNGGTTNSGLSSAVIGNNILNSGNNSGLFGVTNTNSGAASLGSGVNNKNDGSQNLFGGNGNSSLGSNNIYSGTIGNVDSDASIGFGTNYDIQSTATNGLAGGLNNTLIGRNSSALGAGNTATNLNQFVIGEFANNTGNQDATLATPSDHLFLVGNGGSAVAMDNAFAVRRDGVVQLYLYDKVIAPVHANTAAAITALNGAGFTNLESGALVTVEVTVRTNRTGSGPELFQYNSTQSTWELIN